VNNANTNVINTNKVAVPDVQWIIMELNKIYKPCSNTAAMKDFLFRVQKKRE